MVVETAGSGTEAGSKILRCSWLLIALMPEPELGSPEDIRIDREGSTWYCDGDWLARLVASINFGDYESRMYFDRALRQAGVFERMEAMGVQNGDTVSIYDIEFEYQD